MSEYRCKICEQIFPEIPEGVQLLRSQYGVKTYRFTNGDVHILKVVRNKKEPEPRPEPKYIVLPPKHKQVPAAKFPVTVPVIKVPVKVTPKQEEVPEYEDSNWSHPTGKTSMARAFERTKAKMETKQ